MRCGISGLMRAYSPQATPTAEAFLSRSRFTLSSGIAPPAKPTMSSRPSTASDAHTVEEAVAADGIEDEINAPVVGDAFDLGQPIAVGIDQSDSAPRPRATASLSSPRAMAIDVSPSAFARSTAALPTPPAAPCTRTVSPSRACPRSISPKYAD